MNEKNQSQFLDEHDCATSLAEGGGQEDDWGGEKNEADDLAIQKKSSSKGSIRDGDFYGRVYRDYKIL